MLVFEIYALALWIFGFNSAEENIFERSLVKIIQDSGHAVEVHRVQTEDDYILTVVRIPSKWQNPKIAFIMHGLESSAADFVIGGSGASLAYLLADNGYDVWLGNGRGNVFSQAHATLSTESHDFWKFSFHEIGVYDLPAMIDYALDKLNGTSLTYCGFSQGTTSFLILLSMRPEYNSKVSTAHLMAPVAFMRFSTLLRKPMTSIINELMDYVDTTRLYEWFPLSPEIRRLVAYFCNKKIAGRTMCKKIFMIIAGDNPNQYNEDLMPKVFQFYPASGGYRQWIHYGQMIKANGTFAQFDHQRQKNLEIYNQSNAPTYDLSNVHTKLHFLYGLNDVIANPKDVHFLMAKLKASTIGITKINNWNHLDFLFGKDVQRKVNDPILQKIRSRE